VPGGSGTAAGDLALGGAGAAAGFPSPWRVTAFSRSAAAAMCSARGRDTSRARIAEVGVIFIPAMRLSIGRERGIGQRSRSQIFFLSVGSHRLVDPWAPRRRVPGHSGGEPPERAWPGFGDKAGGGERAEPGAAEVGRTEPAPARSAASKAASDRSASNCLAVRGQSAARTGPELNACS